ncbi:hypothetical protein R3W88_026780 [Solanum pinnatisectum]|uniref:Extensin-like n=1 Tax=Solanum pinnatisectum TaxID=50273 RepID=A0AAV9LE65_9SOLN|nr:hypothetical protein R3W88_026780 [Solanum pinnatisectum]
MTNPTTSDPIGPRHIMVPNDSPETSEDRTTIQYDEHIALLILEIEDLRIREHFPPHQPPPTNNNLSPTGPANPPNLLPIYTPLQIQPPTYTTYATPPNPPLVNPHNQPPIHTPYASLPTNTYPLPTTTPKSTKTFREYDLR